jgi:hypothetical protein
LNAHPILRAGSSKNTVSFVPGSDKITVDGLSKIAFWFKFEDKKIVGSNIIKESE